MLIDSHCHLDTFVRSGELEDVIARAELAGVGCFVCAGTDSDDWDVYKNLAERFPGKIVYAVGLHPGNVGEDWEKQLDELPRYFRGNAKPVAVGEIGLDEHYMPKDPAEAERIRALQRIVFERQLALAKSHDLPVIVHAREAFEATVECIDRSGVDWSKVVFHCFSENADAVRILNERGGRASFTGTITYKSADNVREAALAQGLNRLMLETDCPYLAPCKLRGKRNEPAFMRQTAEFVAELFGVSVNEIESRSTANVRDFFRF